MNMTTNFSTNFKLGDLKLMAPQRKEPAAEPEPAPVEGAETTGVDAVDTKAEYDKAYAEAVKKLETYIRENAPKKVDSPSQAFSVTQDFTVNGQKYFITAKPTYYKGTDGAYYLYDPRLKECSRNDGRDMIIDYSVKQVDQNCFYENSHNEGDVNVDNFGDNPAYWEKRYTKDVPLNDGSGKYKLVDAFRYDYKILNSHLPSDIIERFFEQDPEFPEGYKLKENCKKIELVGNDNPPKYKITYTDENGKEREMTISICCSTEGNGIGAYVTRDVDVEEEKAKREGMSNRLRVFLALHDLRRFNIPADSLVSHKYM